MTDIGACLASKKMDWRTPGEVLDLVRALAGGQIELDPCAHPEGLVKATVEYRLDHGVSGLEKGWGVNGLAFVNPPYGRALGRWMVRCASEAYKHRDYLEVVALVPARPDTQWWANVTVADAVCFWTGRIKFLGDDGAKFPAPFPSALVYWGRRAGRFADVFRARGWIVDPTATRAA